MAGELGIFKTPREAVQADEIMKPSGDRFSRVDWACEAHSQSRSWNTSPRTLETDECDKRRFRQVSSTAASQL